MPTSGSGLRPGGPFSTLGCKLSSVPVPGFEDCFLLIVQTWAGSGAQAGDGCAGHLVLLRAVAFLHPGMA